MEATKPKLVPVPEAQHSSPPPPVQVEAPPPRGKKAFLILGGVLGVTAIGIAGYAMAVAGQESTDDAQVEADVVPISAIVGGTVAHVAVKENQSVKKGDLILEINDVEYAAMMNESAAQLETARAQADAADSQAEIVEASATGGLHSAKAAFTGSSVAVSGAEAQIAAANASMQRATAEAHKSELDLTRAKELRASNSIPQGQLDDAQASYDVAHAALAEAVAKLTAAQQMRLGAESRVAEAQGKLDQSKPIAAQIKEAHANADLGHARVKTAEAALALAKLHVSYTKIFAPADGQVSNLAVHEGQLITANQPIVQLVPARTYVVANFKETQVGRMHEGQVAEVSVDTFPGHTLEGKVTSLSGGTGSRFSLLPPDNASGNFVKVVQRVPVRIEWSQNLDLPLRAGLSADVTVKVK